jgi:LuxR family maltose regulon positive regulatory protein
MRTYEEALQHATDDTGAVLRGAADMYVGMSEIYRERNDLAAAKQSLMRSQELGEHVGFTQNPYRWRVAMARIHDAEGDLDSAMELLRAAEPVFTTDFSPDVFPIPAMQARVLIRQGKLDEAFGWARDRGLSVDDSPSYLREYEHITLVRLLLARGAATEALSLLDRLLEAADAGGRIASVIEILILQALASHTLEPLERALTLAEPEGYVRLFLDEGAPMAALLHTAADRRIAPAYVARLLAASGSAQQQPSTRQPLVEPLSDRELDVLRLLGTDLDGPEIANQLMVSLNTMRTHTKSIYTKLGVNSRRAAVRRAEELALLPGSTRR